MKKLLTTLFLTVAFKASLHAQSVSITSSASGAVCAGTNVTFTANISNFTNPYYQWFANGSVIPGATSSTYSSDNLTNGVSINVKVNEGPLGGQITSDLLLLDLDAALQSSYPKSGLKWNNIAPLGNTVVSEFNLTATNAAYSSDYGGVIRFSSAGGWASSTSGFANLSSYTVEIWVRPVGTRGDQDPTTSTNYTPCFFAEIKSANTANKINMALAYNARGLTTGTANNSYRYEAAINNGSWKKYQIATDYSSDLNNWVQIMSVYNGSTVTIYRNGVSLGTSALGVASLAQTSAGYYIGHRWDQTDGVYGDYSKVMLYSKALSNAEVTANYNAFNARFVATGISSSPIIMNISPTTSTSPAITVNGDACVNKTSLTTPTGLTSYAWYKDNVAISGATSNAYIPSASGSYHVTVSNGTCLSASIASAVYTCARNANGRMTVLSSSTTLVSAEGAINIGKGVDQNGKLLVKP